MMMLVDKNAVHRSLRGTICVNMKNKYTETKFLSVTFPTHYIWPNANKIEMIFCRYNVNFNGKRLAVFLNSFLLLQSVLR